jgi:alpha-L-fucosidase
VDIAVKETRHFPPDNTFPGETCWKLEQQWFWQEGFKAASAEAIVGHLNTAHSRNSNFLLNVGPDRQGRIVGSSIKALAEIPELRQKQHANP